MMIEWAEKYRPKTLSEVMGNNKAVETLHAWAIDWDNGNVKHPAALLYGRAGCGKTSAAHALATDMGWDSIELNASDQRTADVIKKVAGSASNTRTFSGLRRLVILDEADNIHGTSDRGGAKAITEIVKKTSQPIILIANDAYGISDTVKNRCEMIQFRSVSASSIILTLSNICQKEHVVCEKGVLEHISNGAGGDMRSAINDLQALCAGRDEVCVSDITTSARDKKDSVFDAVSKVLLGKDIREAVESTYSIDETPPDFIKWVDENVAKMYTGRDLIQSYEYLSRADVFLGRVSKRQNYTFWRYAGMLMTSGVTVSKTRTYKRVQFSPPSVWQAMGRTRSRRAVRDSAASKIAVHASTSTRFARTYYLHFLGKMLNAENKATQVAALMDFDMGEIEYLTGMDKKSVKGIYESAQEMRESSGVVDENMFANLKSTRPIDSTKPIESAIASLVKSSEEKHTQKQIFDAIDDEDKGKDTDKDKDNISNKKDNKDKNNGEAKSPDKDKKQKSLFDF